MPTARRSVSAASLPPLPLLSSLLLLVVRLASGWRWEEDATPFSPSRRVGSYSVDPALCSTLLPSLHHHFLPWQTRTCDDVRALVRGSLDAWTGQAAARIEVREVRHGGAEASSSSTPHVSFESASLDDDPSVVARAWFVAENGTTRVQFSDAKCWYEDAPFCHAVVESFPSRPVLLVAWVASGVALATSCLLSIWERGRRNGARRKGARKDAVAGRGGGSSTTLLLLLLFLQIACPLFHFAILRPCSSCVHFQSTASHEFGHALGFAHSDSANQTCGCGPTASSPCAPPVRPLFDAKKSVMYSSARASSSPCLSPDDLDGLATVFSGTCPSPPSHLPVCYDVPSTLSSSRVATTLVPLLLLASLLLSLLLRSILHGLFSLATTTTSSKRLPPRLPSGRV